MILRYLEIRSGVVQHDTLNDFGSDLAFIGNGLEQFIDAFQFNQRLDIVFLAKQPRNRDTQQSVDFRFEFVDLLATLQDLISLFHVGKQADCLLNLNRRSCAQTRKLDRIVGQRSHVVQRDRVRDVFNHVDDVIQRIDQMLDLVAIQWRDECLVQQVVAVTRQFVCGFLDDFYIPPVSLRVVDVLDQSFERMTAVDDITGMSIEDLEEITVSGHEPAEHRASPRIRRRAARAVAKVTHITVIFAGFCYAKMPGIGEGVIRLVYLT
ncbi:hypothetical protein PSP6_80013 [Paraburkholderia tropica]|nr:hypothetical protein PSP6_80013 [Paraburkholderia tropica]